MPEARLRISRALVYNSRQEPESCGDLTRSRPPCFSNAIARSSICCASASGMVLLVAGAPYGMSGIISRSWRAGSEEVRVAADVE
eukprot:1359076-Rhodomonas_salina.4